MTEQQIAIGTLRLEEMERQKAFPAETLHRLRAWWQGVKYNEAHKVVSFDAYRARREYLP